MPDWGRVGSVDDDDDGSRQAARSVARAVVDLEMSLLSHGLEDSRASKVPEMDTDSENGDNADRMQHFEPPYQSHH